VALAPEQLDLVAMVDELVGEMRQKAEQDKKPISSRSRRAGPRRR